MRNDKKDERMMNNIAHEIDIEKVDISIQLLKQYVKDASIEPLISVLEALKQEPNNESLLTQLSETLNSIGILQGAVLTYAPYISSLISNDLFGDD